MAEQHVMEPKLLPNASMGKLGENLALADLSELPELPTDHADEARVQQQLLAMHLDTSMLNYTPATGVLKNVGQEQANRFDDANKANKRRIFVNKEVLGRLVSVAEELNKAQAQIEIRKVLKKEHKRKLAEQEHEVPDPAVVEEVMAGLQMEGGANDDGEVPPEAKGRATQKAKRMQSGLYRITQVRYPAILSATAPKDRWGYFRAMQRLMPGANGGRPGHIAFGSTAPPAPDSQQQRQRPRASGAAAVKAAKVMIQEAERQAAETATAEAAAALAAAAEAATAGSSTEVDPAVNPLVAGDSMRTIPDLETTVQAVLHANGILEARRAAARQLAEDEGLPVETWWDIMQKRKKMVYFRKLLEEMSGRMDMLRLHRAAKVIQRAWRSHHRARTRNASEEIALLQKELLHRKAMEVALRAAAEAALRDQQERARKRALRLAAKLSVPLVMVAGAGGDRQSPKSARESNGTFSRATSSRNLGWQQSLRGSMAVSRSVSRAVSRATSARQRPPVDSPSSDGGEQQPDPNAPAYHDEQNSLWTKIQALIGTEWDVDEDEDSNASDEDEESEEEEPEEDEESHAGVDDEAERERKRRERRERLAAQRIAKKAVAAMTGAAAGGEGEKKARRRRRKPPPPEGTAHGMFPLSKATILARVVKQAVATAKAMQIADSGKKAKKRKKPGPAKRKKSDPAATMKMLAAAAAALNMTVESYIAMRNRKLGVTQLQPWQPPPQPMVVEADGQAVAIDEEELREMEEEARHELLEKAALNFVANAAAAVRASGPSRTASTAADGGAGGTDSGGAAAAAAATASIDGSVPQPAATWAGAAAAALADGGGGGATSAPAIPPLVLRPGMSAEETAAAFAAAAAPSLTIQEDDVWNLVKEKLRARMAARAAEEAALGAAGGSGVLRLRSQDQMPEEEESSSDESSEDEEEKKKAEEAQRRRTQEEAEAKALAEAEAIIAAAEAEAEAAEGRGLSPAPQDLSQQPGGGEGSGAESDSSYDTMSEEEIKRVGKKTLRKIQRQKDKARKKLQGYYSKRVRAKKASAAAAAEAARAERAAARAARREALARLRKPTVSGPAWRPGGGLGKKRSAAWASTAASQDAANTAAISRRSGGGVGTAARRMPLPRRSPATAAGDGPGASYPPPGARRVRRPLPEIVRLGPYNLSAGGPSLLYRQPVHRVRRSRPQDRMSVRAATWLKGSEVPGAVFTQFGWVLPSAAPSGGLPGTEHTSLSLSYNSGGGVPSAQHSLAQALQSLPEPALLPTLEAFCRRFGIPKDVSARNTRSTHSTHPSLTDSQRAMLGAYPSTSSSLPPSPGGPALRIQSLLPHQSGGSAASGGSGGRPPATPAGAAPGLLILHAPLSPHPPGNQPPGLVRGTRAPLVRHSSAGAAVEDGGSGSGDAAAAAAAVDGGRDGAVSPARSGLSGASSRGTVQRARSHGDALAVTVSGRGIVGPTAGARSDWALTTVGPVGTGGGGGGGGGGDSVAGGAGPFAAFEAVAAAASAAGMEAGGAAEAGSAGALGSVAELHGTPFQVAVTVLRTRDIRPGVAQRLFPLGRAHVNDPESDISMFAMAEAAAAGAAEGAAGGDGPMSFPLDDLSSLASSSSSSDEDDSEAEGYVTVDGEAATAGTEGGEDAAAVAAGGSTSRRSRSQRRAERGTADRPSKAHRPALRVDVGSGGGADGGEYGGGGGGGYDDGEPLEDEEGLRQFDLLYDMTRWAVAPPPTPTNYRPDDDLVAVTLRRSKAAKRREADEQRERLLGPYGRSLGMAYEKVLYRRRQARAMAALAASQSPVYALLRSAAVAGQVVPRPLAPGLWRPLTGADEAAAAAAEAAAAAHREAAAAARRYMRGATTGGGFRRPHRGPGIAAAAAAAAAAAGEPTGEIWLPSSGSRPAMMRVRPGAGCASGFGNSYYWRQPVRLASLIQVRPAAGRGAGTGPAAVAAAVAAPLPPVSTTAAVPRLPLPLELPLALPPPPPEVTEMAETAFKLLSELGSEIGRMEQQLEALKRRAELEERRKATATAAAEADVGASAAPQAQLLPGQHHHHHHPHVHPHPHPLSHPHFHQVQDAALAREGSAGDRQGSANPATYQGLPSIYQHRVGGGGSGAHRLHSSGGGLQSQQHRTPQQYPSPYGPPATPNGTPSNHHSHHGPGTPSGALYKTQYLTLHQQHSQHHASHHSVPRNRLSQPPQRAPALALDLPDGIQGTSAPRVPHPVYHGSVHGGVASSNGTASGAAGSPSSRSLAGATRHTSAAASSARHGPHSAGASSSTARQSGASTARSLAQTPSSAASSGGAGAGVCTAAAAAADAAEGGGDAGSVHSHSAPLLRFSQTPGSKVVRDQTSGIDAPNAEAPPELRPLSSFGPAAGNGTASAAPSPEPAAALTSPLQRSESASPDPSGVAAAASLPGPPLTAAPARRMSPRAGLLPTRRGSGAGGMGSPTGRLGPAGGSRGNSLSGVASALDGSPVAAALAVAMAPATNGTLSPRTNAVATVTSGEVGPWEADVPEGGKPATTLTKSRANSQLVVRLGSPPSASATASALPSITAATSNSTSGAAAAAGAPPAGYVEGPPGVAAAAAAAGGRHSLYSRAAMRQGSYGVRDSVTPSGQPPPSAAWVAQSSSLPDISHGMSPRSAMTAPPGARASISYTPSSTAAGPRTPLHNNANNNNSTNLGAAAAAGASALAIGVAARVAQSPPHSPLRTYPRMELGLGSPLRTRRGSANGPTLQYYSFTTGGQTAMYDSCDAGIGVGVSVDSLLLNVSLLNAAAAAAAGNACAGAGAGPERGQHQFLQHPLSGHRVGGGQGVLRRPRTSEAPHAAAAAATSAALAELGITGTASAGAGVVNHVTYSAGAGASSRFGRIRRLSIGPGPGAAVAAGAAAAQGTAAAAAGS